MRRASVKVMELVVCAILLGAATMPAPAAAQSQLDVAQAQAFMGKWVVAIESDFGQFSFDLELTDQSGKVAATMSSPEMGGSQEITDIARSDESLVMHFEANAQGQFFPVALTLSPNGENLDVYFEVGTGEFSATGVGTRAAS